MNDNKLSLLGGSGKVRKKSNKKSFIPTKRKKISSSRISSEANNEKSEKKSSVQYIASLSNLKFKSTDTTTATENENNAISGSHRNVRSGSPLSSYEENAENDENSMEENVASVQPQQMRNKMYHEKENSVHEYKEKLSNDSLETIKCNSQETSEASSSRMTVSWESSEKDVSEKFLQAPLRSRTAKIIANGISGEVASTISKVQTSMGSYDRDTNPSTSSSQDGEVSLRGDLFASHPSKIEGKINLSEKLRSRKHSSPSGALLVETKIQIENTSNTNTAPSKIAIGSKISPTKQKHNDFLAKTKNKKKRLGNAIASVARAPVKVSLSSNSSLTTSKIEVENNRSTPGCNQKKETASKSNEKLKHRSQGDDTKHPPENSMVTTVGNVSTVSTTISSYIPRRDPWTLDAAWNIPPPKEGSNTLRDFCSSFKVEKTPEQILEEAAARERKNKKQKEQSREGVATKNAADGGNSNNAERPAIGDDDNSADKRTGPQVQIINGEIHVVEESLNAQRKTTEDIDNEFGDDAVVEEDSGNMLTATYTSFTNWNKRINWSITDTKKFFFALRSCGTDFTSMEVYFKSKFTRQQLRKKYLLESRKNPKLVNLAMRPKLRKPLDAKLYGVQGNEVEAIKQRNKDAPPPPITVEYTGNEEEKRNDAVESTNNEKKESTIVEEEEKDAYTSPAAKSRFELMEEFFDDEIEENAFGSKAEADSNLLGSGNIEIENGNNQNSVGNDNAIKEPNEQDEGEKGATVLSLVPGRSKSRPKGRPKFKAKARMRGKLSK